MKMLGLGVLEKLNKTKRILIKTILLLLFFYSTTLAQSIDERGLYAIQLCANLDEVNYKINREEYKPLNVYGTVMLSKFNNGVLKVYLVDLEGGYLEQSKALKILKRVKKNKHFKNAFLVKMANKAFDTGIVNNENDELIITVKLNNKTNSGLVSNFENVNTTFAPPVDSYEVFEERKISINNTFGGEDFYSIQVGCFNNEVSNETLFQNLELNPLNYVNDIVTLPSESEVDCEKRLYGEFMSRRDAQDRLDEILEDNYGNRKLDSLFVIYCGPDPNTKDKYPVDRTNKKYTIQIGDYTKNTDVTEEEILAWLDVREIEKEDIKLVSYKTSNNKVARKAFIRPVEKYTEVVTFLEFLQKGGRFISSGNVDLKFKIIDWNFEME